MQTKEIRRQRASYLIMSDEAFTAIVLGCNTLGELATMMGNKLRPDGRPGYGRGYTAIRNRVRALGLCSHFIETHRTRGKDARIHYDQLQTRGSVRRRILQEGLMAYECAMPECRNPGIWLGKPLSLHLDHKDGDNSNHALENLRWLCPNCHSQTDTYGGRNAKKNRRALPFLETASALGIPPASS